MRSSCINHPPDEPLIVIRQWQVELCEGNTTAAALLSFFEYWHNIKVEMRSRTSRSNDIAEMHGDKRTQDESLLQFHTEEELISGIMIAKRDTIRKALSYLSDAGLVSIHANPNPKYAFDKTRYFLFHPEPVNQWLSEKRPSAKVQQTKSKNRHGKASSENRQRQSENQSGQSENQSAITETSAEITSETFFPLTPKGESSASVEEEEGSTLTAREEEAESESSDRPSLEKELTPVQPTQVSGKDKSSAPVVATKKQNSCLQDCRSGADVLEQLSNDPGILDCDPVPRTVLQEMQLRNWVWPWRRDRRTILPEFLQFHTNQMPTSKNDQADMSATEKARRNILNSEKTVGGLILLATEFESFKSGAAQATKRVNGHEPIRIDFEERFVQAQRLGMAEGDWFRDELGQIRVRLFGGELVTQAKFMTLPLEKPKDLQTPEEARSLLDQIRQFKAQAAQKLHNSRAKQTKTPVANVAVAPKPLVDNVVGLCDRRTQMALMQQLRAIEAELADPALLKDPLTQARAESFVSANSDRFRVVRGKDNLILAIEEPTF